MCVCVCVYVCSAAEKPPLLCISGFVSAVCLARLPQRQTLQASFRATLLALAVFMMARNSEREETKREGGRERERERETDADRKRTPDVVFINHVLFFNFVFCVLSFSFVFFSSLFIISPHSIPASNNSF